MRNLLKISLVFLLAFFTFLACEDDLGTLSTNDQIEVPKSLGEDEVFLSLVQSNIDVVSRGVNVDRIEAFSSKNDLTNQEMNQLAIFMGFESFDDYQDFFEKQKKDYEYLDEVYDFRSYSEEKLYSEMEKSRTMLIEKNIKTRVADPCNCDANQTSCVLAVAAEAAIMHGGCFYLDLTGAAGIACHAAAFAYQAAASAVCDYNGRNCKANCTEDGTNNQQGGTSSGPTSSGGRGGSNSNW